MTYLLKKCSRKGARPIITDKINFSKLGGQGHNGTDWGKNRLKHEKGIKSLKARDLGLFVLRQKENNRNNVCNSD